MQDHPVFNQDVCLHLVSLLKLSSIPGFLALSDLKASTNGMINNAIGISKIALRMFFMSLTNVFGASFPWSLIIFPDLDITSLPFFTPRDLRSFSI